MLRFTFSLLLFSLVTVSANGEDFRTWADSTGQRTITAKLVDVKKADSLVILQKEGSDKQISVKLKDLSKTDQNWIREYIKNKSVRRVQQFDFAGLRFKLIDGEDPYYMAICETTVANFALFANQTNYITGAEHAKRKVNWKSPDFGQTPRDPVVFVSWYDCKEYISWLNKLPPKGRPEGLFSLPTESQWVNAARADSIGDYYWNGPFDVAFQFCNFKDKSVKKNKNWENRFNDGYQFSAPVGSYKPNAWGLYDVLGNVEEWTEEKAVRGGHFQGGCLVCNLNFRSQQEPGSAVWIRGFRVCFVPE